MIRKSLPPPERATFKDLLQVILGLIMIPLGATIAFETFTRGAAAPGLLIGTAFLGFGLYRTTEAWGRWRWYQRAKGKQQHA